MKNKLITILIYLLAALPLYAQFNTRSFSISAGGVYTTSAEIFLNPNSADITLRNSSFELENIINPFFDIRYRLTEPLIIGFNIEYMTKKGTGRNVTVFVGSSTTQLEVEDGLKLIPVELTLHYVMPFSTEDFKFLMSGGGGVYFGEQTRSFGDASITSGLKKIAAGIHVGVSMEYLYIDNAGVRFEMKFRDPEYLLENKYDRDVINYRGSQIQLQQRKFDSKINVNGISFLLGFTYQF